MQLNLQAFGSIRPLTCSVYGLFGKRSDELMLLHNSFPSLPLRG